MVDGEAGEDRREVGARRAHVGFGSLVPAQVGLLDQVFGIRHAAEHPVRDGEQQGTHRGEHRFARFHGTHDYDTRAGALVTPRTTRGASAESRP
jgi:hypothetical protein